MNSTLITMAQSSSSSAALLHMFWWILLPVTLATLIGYPLWVWSGGGNTGKKLAEQQAVHQKETAKFQADIAALHSKLAEAQSNHVFQRRELEQLQAQLLSAEAKSKQVQSSPTAETNSTVQALRAEVEGLWRLANEAKARLQSKEEDFGLLQSNYTLLQIALKNSQAELSKSQKASEDYRRLLASLLEETEAATLASPSLPDPGLPTLSNRKPEVKGSTGKKLTLVPAIDKGKQALRA